MASWSKSSGFTRVDLLVTIVLMVLVVVLLLPMLRNIQQTKHNTTCQLNLRDNAVATLAYSQAHNGRFPPLAFFVSDTDQGELSITMETKTAAAAGIDFYQLDSLICPSDSQEKTIPIDFGTPYPEHLRVSYGYNIALIEPDVRLQDIPKPATTAVFYDGLLDQSNTGSYPNALAFAQKIAIARHEGHLNLVYADCHTVMVSRIEEAMILIETEP